MRLIFHFPHNKRKNFLIIGALAAAVLIGFILFLQFAPIYALPGEVSATVHDEIQKQSQIEKAIETEALSGVHSFTNPFVIQNPYGTAPLTALLIFETAEKSQVTVHIPGNTPEAAVDFTFPGYRSHHEIPVYGLYAGMDNQVILEAVTQAGVKQKTTVALPTEPLPDYLEPLRTLQLVREKYSSGLNFTFLDHKTIFDIDGVVRWYSTEKTFKVYTPLKNGHFLYTSYPVDNMTILWEKDLLGKIYAVYYFTNVHHDVIELPQGNLLLTSEEDSATTELDHLLEIDRQSGHIVRDIDLKNYLDQNRPFEIDRRSGDWLHLNSISYDPADHSIIISGRSQSAVVKFSYPEMKIQWILGPHDNWSDAYQQFLLTPSGDNFEWQWAQHHVTSFRNSPASNSILDVFLFDNGLYRSFQPESADNPSNSYSRMVHYRIDERTKKVEQVWEYGKERGTGLFSITQGSVYPLDNGNILGTFSNLANDPGARNIQELLMRSTNADTEARLIEVDPQSNAVVYEASIHGTTSYRAFRAGLYDGYTGETSLSKIPVNDTSPTDLYDRLQLFIKDMKRWSIQTWSDFRSSPVWVYTARFVRRLLSYLP